MFPHMAIKSGFIISVRRLSDIMVLTLLLYYSIVPIIMVLTLRAFNGWGVAGMSHFFLPLGEGTARK